MGVELIGEALHGGDGEFDTRPNVHQPTVPGDKASWGRLIQAGWDQLRDAWWWSMCPSSVFFFTILSLNVLQDRVQARWLGLSRRSSRTLPIRSDDVVAIASAPNLTVGSIDPTALR